LTSAALLLAFGQPSGLPRLRPERARQERSPSGSGTVTASTCLIAAGVRHRHCVARRPGSTSATAVDAVTGTRPGRRRATIRAMRAKRFSARIAADPRGHAVITVPFDPDEAWGAKAQHHVNGTVNGCRVRVTIAPGDSGWGFTLNPARMRDTGNAAGSDVIVELAPE